jgi:hypothetical protein
MLVGFLLAGAIVGGTTSCDPIPGSDQILNDRANRWIIIGEQHGTTEAPKIFADLACLAWTRGRPPVVAVEFPADGTDVIQDFLSLPDERAAKERLLAHRFWHGAFQDGRSSKAMLGLFERLRQLKRSKVIADVVAFQPIVEAKGEAYEKAMALNVEKAAAGGNLVLVLIGNVHARLTQWQSSTTSYLPMAGHLPRGHTVSYNIGDHGGAQWACFTDPAAKGGVNCGPREHGLSERKYGRGVVHTGGEGHPYSGYLNLGSATTASAPAIIK